MTKTAAEPKPDAEGDEEDEEEMTEEEIMQMALEKAQERDRKKQEQAKKVEATKPRISTIFLGIHPITCRVRSRPHTTCF